MNLRLRLTCEHPIATFINRLTNDCSNLNLAYYKFVIRLFWKKTTRDTYWGTPAINNRYNNAQSSVLWLIGLLDCQRVDLGMKTYYMYVYLVQNS